MKKYHVFLLVVMIGMCCVGCSDKSYEVVEETETTEIDNKSDVIINIDNSITKNHVDMTIDEGPEGTFYTVPMYFQQEFENVEFGRLNASENGNLITCLSMLDSFYASDYITPDEFVEKYKSYISEDGEYTPDEIINAVATGNNRVMTKVPLDVYTLKQYVKDYYLAVLVHINHASIYGEDSSYLIITDITDDGKLIVRDPNKSNIDKYATIRDGGETIYETFDFFLAAGRNATVYVLGGGVYEIEEKGYEYIENLN